MAGMMCKALSSGTDLNTVKDNGMYFIGTNNINSPVSYFYFIVLKTIHNADLIQFGFSLLDEHLYKRTYNNGVWSEWKTFG